MKPSSSKNLNPPLIIDLDPDTSSSSSSVGSNFEAEINANDYLPNPVSAPANVNLPLVADEEIIFERESDINRWIDEHITEDVDMDHVNDVLTDTSELPSGLNSKLQLRNYQKQFLAWALKQEQTDAKGGILADEMGMGKTIQAISLVLAKREIDRAQSNEPMGYTLVICSSFGLSYWSYELAQFTSTKVLKYFGSRNNQTIEEFRNYDFVLTTYTTVSNECKYRVEVDRRMSSLHSVKWNRIILDEVIDRFVHPVTNGEAVFALEATYRWVLTSDPLLNNFDNLYFMICLLHTRRFTPYFCNPCDCEPSNRIVYGRLCYNCGHSGIGYFRYWWDKFVVEPILENQDTMMTKRAKILLKHKILKGILIRRTNLGRAAPAHLAPRTRNSF